MASSVAVSRGRGHRFSLVAALIALAAPAWVLGCGDGADTEDVAPATAGHGEIARFELVISDGKVDGADTLRVVVGQPVELIWSSDAAVTVHVHGYDLELRLEPRSRRAQRFIAAATGRFPVTAHGIGPDAPDGHDHGEEHAQDHGSNGPGGSESADEPTLVYLEVHPR